jgi:putative endonuclease
MQNSETGKLGEEIAAQYLCGKHYLILIRNHREKFDEIDIIARHSDGTLIFCEVKTINGTHERYSDFFMPEDHLDQRKIKKLIRSSSIFLAKCLT